MSNSPTPFNLHQYDTVEEFHPHHYQQQNTSTLPSIPSIPSLSNLSNLSTIPNPPNQIERNLAAHFGIFEYDHAQLDNDYTEEEYSDDEEEEAHVGCYVCGRNMHYSEYDAHMNGHVSEFVTISRLPTMSMSMSPFGGLNNVATMDTFSGIPFSSLFSASTSNLNTFNTTNALNTLNTLNTFNALNTLNTFNSANPSTTSLFSFFTGQQYEPFLDDLDDYEANLRIGDLIGKVEIGVSDIDNVSKLQDTWEIDDDTTCPICIETIKSKDCKSRVLLCNHTYCQDCIEQWLSKNKKCPVCNIDLEDKFQNQQQEKIDW
jgi:hypothetical protein